MSLAMLHSWGAYQLQSSCAAENETWRHGGQPPHREAHSARLLIPLLLARQKPRVAAVLQPFALVGPHNPACAPTGKVREARRA